MCHLCEERSYDSAPAGKDSQAAKDQANRLAQDGGKSGKTADPARQEGNGLLG